MGGKKGRVGGFTAVLVTKRCWIERLKRGGGRRG